mmetsp:Transcript_6229/g.18408  ORF Transcript_6229/g.18408 Transcript_6229/m.18408 type:complete len:258 (+) Transcript_6229:420-1193(+)
MGMFSGMPPFRVGSSSSLCCSTASAWSRAISAFSIPFSSWSTRRTASASARSLSHCAMSSRRRLSSAACSSWPAASFTSSPRRAWSTLSALPALFCMRPSNSPRSASIFSRESWARVAAILSSVSMLSLSALGPWLPTWVVSPAISALMPSMFFSCLAKFAPVSCQSSFTHAKIISELLIISSFFGSSLFASASWAWSSLVLLVLALRKTSMHLACLSRNSDSFDPVLGVPMPDPSWPSWPIEDSEMFPRDSESWPR